MGGVGFVRRVIGQWDRLAAQALPKRAESDRIRNPPKLPRSQCQGRKPQFCRDDYESAALTN